MKTKISLDIGYGHAISAIKKGYKPYRIGPWISIPDDQMKVNSLKTDIVIRKALIKQNNGYRNLVETITEVLNQYHGVKKTPIYWENICGYTISAVLPVVILLWYRIREFEERFECYYQACPPKWVPGRCEALDKTGKSKYMLAQIAVFILKQRGLSKRYESSNILNIENPNDLFPPLQTKLCRNDQSGTNDRANTRKHPYAKLRKVINRFGMHMLDLIGYKFVNRNRVIVTPSPFDFRLRLLISIWSGTCLVRNIDRMNGKYRERYDTLMFAEWNEQRDKLSKMVANYTEGIEDELQQIVTAMIPLVLPGIGLENWEKHSKESYEILKKPPLACFIFSSEMERARYAEMGGKVVTSQHSFAYDVLVEISAFFSERSISTYRQTWGKVLYPADIPMTSVRVGSFKEAYISEKKQLDVFTPQNISGAILWMPNSYEPDSFDIFDTIEDHIAFLDATFFALQRNAPKLLIRIKPDMMDPFTVDNHSFRNRIKRYQVSNDNPSGKSVASSSIVVCEHLAGSILIECISVNHPVLVILKKWPGLLNDQANDVFLKLKDAGVVRHINDCDDDILSRIFENPCDWWNEQPVKRAVNNFRRIYLPEMPNELQQWLYAIRLIRG